MVKMQRILLYSLLHTYKNGRMVNFRQNSRAYESFCVDMCLQCSMYILVLFAFVNRMKTQSALACLSACFKWKWVFFLPKEKYKCYPEQFLSLSLSLSTTHSLLWMSQLKVIVCGWVAVVLTFTFLYSFHLNCQDVCVLLVKWQCKLCCVIVASLFPLLCLVSLSLSLSLFLSCI